MCSLKSIACSVLLAWVTLQYSSRCIISAICNVRGLLERNRKNSLQKVVYDDLDYNDNFMKDRVSGLDKLILMIT
ncbi:hypothetical protein DSUL_170040 [Desulfovibrionales bacterium]